VSAAALRHFIYSTHYRKQMNLSGSGLEASLEAVRRVGDFAHRLETARGGTPELAVAAAEGEQAFRSALRDDLNAPEAVAALFTFLQRANAELDRKGSDTAALEEARRVFALMDSVLDVQPRAQRVVVGADRVDPDPGSLTGLEPLEREQVRWAVERLRDRLSARAQRDFAASDAIRAEVEERGFVVKDTPAGTQLERWM
jgi:cysteinyl-tRNA synthetase